MDLTEAPRQQEGRAPLRDRLYGHYAAQARLPSRVEELSSRGPYLKHLVRRHFPRSKEARVLDLGCGYGALVHFARQEGYERMEGIDVSRDQVEGGKRLGIEGLRHGDLLESMRETPDATYDVVIAFDVLEHFRKEELAPFVDQVRRILAPGGIWILHVPNAESPFFGRIRYGDLTHEIAFTKDSIAHLLGASGFSQVQSFEDTPIVHGVPSLARAITWRALRAILRFFVFAETGNPGRSSILSQNLLAVARR